MPSIQLRTASSDGDDVGPALAAISITFTVLAFITTILRLWVRKERRALGWDDYMIAAGMFLAIIECGLITKAVTRGKGKRAIRLSQADIEFVNMYSWWAQHVLFWAMAAIKTSVCLLVSRINSSRKLKWFIGVVIAVMVASTLEVSIVLLAQCRPISAFWRPSSGKCWPSEVRIYSIYVQASLSIVTDLICSLLPIAIIWNVQLPLQKKISIWVLMAMGLICTSCSAVRAKSLNAKAKDIAFEYAIVAIWAATELGLGIIATNLGLSRSIYHHFFQKDSNTTNASYRNTYAHGSRSRSGYSQHQDQIMTNEVIHREPSMTGSENSDIPLKPVIQKTTEIRIQDVHSTKEEGSGQAWYSLTVSRASILDSEA